MTLPEGLVRQLHSAPGPGETVLSIIDLGTNSIRLDLVAVKGRSTRRLHREKRMVRLGDGLYANGHIHEAALVRVEEALELFQALHRAAGVRHIAAVATAAMRNAPEAPLLTARWAGRYGIDFQVISGVQEAALIARGVLGNERLPSGSYGLVDIGGGSTELSLCLGSKALEGFSLDLGANRLQQEFLKHVPPVKGGVEALRQRARGLLGPLRAEHRWPPLRELIGSGGTVRSLQRLAKAAGVKDQPFTAHFLHDLVARMAPLNRVGLLHLPGMDEKRVDLILPGALILEEACLILGTQKIRATEATLRDGLLSQELDRLSGR